ncbi:hypothetical protein JS868_003053 [Escherichia coli]|nr:hypothetical protein [Escherichia coli]
MTTQLTTHFVEALRTTTNNNKQKGNLLAVLLNRYHFSAIRHEAGGCFSMQICIVSNDAAG